MRMPVSADFPAMQGGTEGNSLHVNEPRGHGFTRLAIKTKHGNASSRCGWGRHRHTGRRRLPRDYPSNQIRPSVSGQSPSSPGRSSASDWPPGPRSRSREVQAARATGMHTQVGIVGAGPAGLLLSLMLQRRGIDCIIVEARAREVIEETVRAGILEQSTVDLMEELGVADRLRREGVAHEGILLRFGGRNHRIDFKALTGGRVATLYPQHEVLKDLITARLEQGGQILFETNVTAVSEVESTTPVIRFVTPRGEARELRCDVVIGSDGSHGVCRSAFPTSARTEYLRIYPFGWFGILCKAQRSSEELIYARHERGFALISSRTPQVQRMYFQCDPNDQVENWSEDRIWSELQARISGEDGFRLKEGKILQKNIVPMRSYVCEPMQHGRLYLAGDAAHAVPPTGAKGMNLAVADIRVLAHALTEFYGSGNKELLDAYSEICLRRVWRAQRFSWWMTSMLHRFDRSDPFQLKVQQAELDYVTTSRAAATTIAENYVGAALG